MKKTINEAIVEVLKKENKPLTGKEIYNRIIEMKLYHFNSESAESIVRNQLRRNSKNVDLPNSSNVKLYVFHKDNTFSLV